MRKLTFILLCLEGAVLSFNVAATAAIVPSVAKEFVLSQFVAGKIIWLYMLPYGLAALLYGPLVRAFDAKKIEIICLFLFSLSNLLAAASQNINTLFVARFFTGLFGASVIPLGIILVAKHVESRNRGKSIGIFFGSTFIASLLGLFLSGLLHWRMIYYIPAVLGLFLCILLVIYLPSFKEDTSVLSFRYFRAFKHKKVIYIFTYIFIISLLYHGVQQWLSVYFSSSFGLNQFLISMLITLTSLSGIFGEVIGGLFSDNIGRRHTANIGIILMIISVFLLLIKFSPIFLAILMISWGLGWTINHAAVSTALTDLPGEYLNEAASLNSSIRFISGGVGTALSGILMQKSFVLGFGVLGIGLVVLLVSQKVILRR